MPALTSAGPRTPGPVILTTTERYRSRSMRVTRPASIRSAPPVSRPVIRWTIVAIAESVGQVVLLIAAPHYSAIFTNPCWSGTNEKSGKGKVVSCRIEGAIAIMRHRAAPRHLLSTRARCPGQDRDRHGLRCADRDAGQGRSRPSLRRSIGQLGENIGDSNRSNMTEIN